MTDVIVNAPPWLWPSVSYFGFALATFGITGLFTCKDEYDTGTRVARILVTALWPLYWGAALGFWLYERTSEWKGRRR